MEFHDLALWLEDSPDRELLVSPVHLAGASDQLELAAEFADPALAPGWITEEDQYAGTYAASASRQLVFAHRPQHDTEFEWAATWAPTPLAAPEWMVAMSGHTPDEVVRAVTTTLRSLPEADPRTPGCSTPVVPFTAEHTDPNGLHPLAAVLEDAYWHRLDPTLADTAGSSAPGRARTTQTVSMRSPDGHAVLTCALGQDWAIPAHGGQYAWELAVSPYRAFQPPALGREFQWRLVLTAGAPVALLHAAMRAVTDPTPVRRHVADLANVPAHLIRVLPVEWAAPDLAPAPSRDTLPPAPTAVPGAATARSAATTPVLPSPARERKVGTPARPARQGPTAAGETTRRR